MYFYSADGSSGFKAERNRYHLYISYACPWAHRALICRKLKGLDDVIKVDVVDPMMSKDGWQFSAEVRMQRLQKCKIKITLCINYRELTAALIALHDP